MEATNQQKIIIPVCEPTLRGNEEKYVLDALRTGWISSFGKYLKEFEEKFAAYCNVKYGVSCANGTVALHLALEALGIGKRDEVIIPTFTMIASCNAVLYTGAKPVLVDSELETWNMDVHKIEEKITPETKAIMVVHTYGHPVDMDVVQAIAKKHKLFVIEDAAEAHGAEYKGKKAGSLSDVACFSFYANKIITCFPPSTKILIEPPKGNKGSSRMKYIKDLRMGDSVLTYDINTSAKEYKKITRTFEREYHQQMVNLVFSNNNKLCMTPNHPVYVVNKGWVPAELLKIGDEVIQYNYRGLAYKERYTGKTYDAIMGKEEAEKKCRNHSLIIKQKHKDPNSGYVRIDRMLVALKIGKGNKGKKRSKTQKKRLHNLHLLRWKMMSSDKYEEFCRKMNIINSNSEVRMRKSEVTKKLVQDPKYIQRVSAGVKKAMQKESYWKNYVKGMNLKPNKPERFLSTFLEEHFPGEFGYNGDYRLGVRIDRLIPDFVHIKGKKKVIDFLGSYWHTKKEFFTRSERYRKYDYDCLILWEQELKDKEMLKERIKTFIYNPNVKIVKVTKITTKNYTGKVYNIETEKNNNYFAHGILVHNCGEGGMIITNNKTLAEKAKALRNHHFGEPRFVHHYLGYNYRMTNVQAAIGLAQLEKIEHLVESRRKNALLYNAHLKNIKGIVIPPEQFWAKNVYWMYGILVTPEFGMTMPDVRQKLGERGIETRTFFVNMHNQPVYKEKRGHHAHPETTGHFPNAEILEKSGLYLPSSSHLTEEQITYIAKNIQEIQHGK